ncbi:MAG: hypothetical protein LUH54_05210, partial [Firmicutes bacterium]|nr:hypothetical protein [Bacillota bacterium]
VISAAIYNRNADCRALNLRTENGGTTFDLIYSGRVITNIEIPVQGTHNVQDAMYAYIVGDCCGLTDDRIRAGLKNFINVSMRQMIYDIEGITVIDDAYNASPESMRAAINVLASMSRERGGRATALLGDMMELGESSALMHEKIGSYAAKSGVKVLFTYGVLAENIANAAIRNGIRAENVHVSLDTNDPQTMAEIMFSKLKPGDILLIKASRAVHAENVTERLKLLLKKTNDTE